MRAEPVAGRLKPKWRDMSRLTLRAPLHIAGALKHPKIRPEVGPLALRGLAAAALFVVAPPAALLPLIETGPGKDMDCGASSPNVRAIDPKAAATDQKPPATNPKAR